MFQVLGTGSMMFLGGLIGSAVVGDLYALGASGSEWLLVLLVSCFLKNHS